MILYGGKIMKILMRYQRAIIYSVSDLLGNIENYEWVNVNVNYMSMKLLRYYECLITVKVIQ